MMANFRSGLTKKMKESDENSDYEEENIKVINNDIYFYSDVTNESILELTIAIKKLTNELLIKNISYNVEIPINLHINSDGGDVYAVLSIIYLMENNKIDINTIIEGKACSAATILSLFGTNKYITRNSYMLIHNISSDFWGKMHEIEDEMKNLILLTKDVKKIYKTYSSISVKQLETLLKKDLLLDAGTCLKYGLVDDII
jgi:ATP-dependent Clp endopeptidase proteolytic subunit ClpP